MLMVVSTGNRSPSATSSAAATCGVVRQVLQIAVDHHGALRVAGEHHLGVRALRGERLELIGGRIGAVLDAVHEVHPATDPTFERDRRGRVLHGLCGDGPSARGQFVAQLQV